MKKLVACLLTGLVAFAGLSFVLSSDVEARPQYLKAFAEKYEKVKEQADTQKCGVCHGEMGKNKKVVSAYGKLLKEALGKANVKEVEAINESLEKVGKMECADGKTFADLLNDGKLPPPAAE